MTKKVFLSILLSFLVLIISNNLVAWEAKQMIEFHEKCIYPTVRIRADRVGGSGTIIYSKSNDKGDFDTFILTNHHVISSLITTREDWDSLLKRNIKKEYLAQATVEIFDYVKTSTVNSANAHQADIVAYDQVHDLAILKLDSPKEVRHAANLIPRDNIKNLFLTTDVAVVGCSLLHDPVVSFGKITCLKEIIENKLYLMTSADSYFGNSGGALYLLEKRELIGVPSRVSAMQLGFGVDIITWMGFACHPQRLYEFIDEQELKFLYDPKDNFIEAQKRREKKQKEAIFDVLKGGIPEK